ncbi:LOW QUALITY PROTEIN: Glycosyltransferase [Methyloversatilis universalis FAM5]|uniref:Glycosyltransferase n=1 Tax=Methyloversatilis universalis (strain ATCC BAA-1314 / DSM 25237 / JCM 13912 / CCUG 52030 / FAM5) TaxID=1000565 RepID=F5RHH7_METUF|nr:glycosyltransferase [Methyloversatilis universalis]EGK69809.1 LOW QUALITY PROTEIN: Glycosyltransferase [Methyloversatilis universalis FAM5]
MNLPHVSIIMPCYNAAAHLARSVGSVQAQTFDDWELVAIDDGSGDDTAARLAAMAADDPRIRVFTQPNGGVSRARNRGLSEARGRCIAFLDADDDWHPDFLARMTGALRAEPDAVLAYCGWQNIGLSGGRAQPFVPPDYETPDKREKLFAGCRWPIHATLTRREAVTAAGGFDTALKNAEDYAMWLRIAGRAPITRVAEVLAFYHFHSGTQASSAHARAALDFADAQLDYLADHPDFTATLGADRIRQMVFGTLLTRGNECFWKRNLKDARLIFRRVMAARYGGATDWLRMLPALLPERAYGRLIGALDRLGAMRTAR